MVAPWNPGSELLPYPARSSSTSVGRHLRWDRVERVGAAHEQQDTRSECSDCAWPATEKSGEDRASKAADVTL